MNSSVITRFAPSPTGSLHLGGARTAFFAYLFAKANQGQFLIRIEDTDQERSKEEFTVSLLKGLSWLGMESDGEILYQSQRHAFYQKNLEKLLDAKEAYYCTCDKERLTALREEQLQKKEKPKYDGHCRNKTLAKPNTPHVVRLKAPQEGETSFEDAIRGIITFQNHELDDLILQKSDGSYTYNFTVVIDDATSHITHVLRGEDHINNTPKQILLYQALGHAIPVFAHLSMIHGEDGSKLSKRHGALDILSYQKEGFSAHAVRNFLLRLGFSHGDQELFSDEEMTQHFSLQKLSKSKAIFSTQKLLWFNSEKLKLMSPKEIVANYQNLQPLSGNLSVLEGIALLYRPALKTFLEHRFTAETLLNPQIKLLNEEDSQRLSRLKKRLVDLENWNEALIDTEIKSFIQDESVGFAKVGKPLRLALFGIQSTPALGGLIALFPKEEILQKLPDSST